jgi:hypothetical protein
MFFDPSDSYFLLAEEWGYHRWALAHSSSWFFFILLAVYIGLPLSLKCFIVTKLASSNYYYFFILIKLFHVVFRSIINNIYLQKHFKTGSCDVPEGPKGMNLQNYLPCIFLLTWIKNLYKINLSYNELLLSLDIWQLSSNFRTFEILQAISWP